MVTELHFELKVGNTYCLLNGFECSNIFFTELCDFGMHLF